jgi:hypothetical protein
VNLPGSSTTQLKAGSNVQEGKITRSKQSVSPGASPSTRPVIVKANPEFSVSCADSRVNPAKQSKQQRETIFFMMYIILQQR